MKLYGVGAIKNPSTGKVVWDFEDGPFETEDPELIEEALRRGASADYSGDREIEALIEKAHELGIGAPSTLKRWSVERLEREIAEAEDKAE